MEIPTLILYLKFALGMAFGSTFFFWIFTPWFLKDLFKKPILKKTFRTFLGYLGFAVFIAVDIWFSKVLPEEPAWLGTSIIVLNGVILFCLPFLLSFREDKAAAKYEYPANYQSSNFSFYKIF